MNNETPIQTQILNALGSRPDIRLFRNNTGQAWQGVKVVSPQKDILCLKNARPIVFGLITGGSDLIGLRTITITPKMVGQRVAVFTAIEVKAGKRGATEEQECFIKMVQDCGGFSGIARSVEDAIKLVEGK
jgi:hypothetical protein